MFLLRRADPAVKAGEARRSSRRPWGLAAPICVAILLPPQPSLSARAWAVPTTGGSSAAATRGTAPTASPAHRCRTYTVSFRRRDGEAGRRAAGTARVGRAVAIGTGEWPVGLPAPFAAYLREFAAGRFFEAHEALEPLWWERQSDPFLHGLILFAAAFVKLERGNPTGARRHFVAAVRYLEPYAPDHLGLRVADVVAHARAAADTLGRQCSDPCAAGVPPFRFTLAPDAGRRWAAAPQAVMTPDLAGAIREAIATRRAAGWPVGPASWAEVVREVTLTTLGRVPRNTIRQAVRQALEETVGDGAPGHGSGRIDP